MSQAQEPIHLLINQLLQNHQENSRNAKNLTEINEKVGKLQSEMVNILRVFVGKC